MLGFVKVINSKDGKSKKPPYKSFTSWSMIMENQDGSESGWISLGFSQPSFPQGQWANYTTETGKFGLDLKSFEKAEAPAVPTREAPPAAKNTYVDRNDSIVYQSSRKDALTLVGLLLEHNGLPMSSSAAKAGQAARYEEITAYVDKLTVEYFNDVQSGRLFREVVDAGAAEEGSGEAESAGGEVDND